MAIQICTKDRSRLSLGGGGLNSARKLAAVLVVLIMLIVPFTVWTLTFSDATEGEDVYIVTYHPGDIGNLSTSYNGTPSSNGYSNVDVTYYGVPVAEYNPQFWNGNFSGNGDSDNWYPINEYVKGSTGTIVFTGWKLYDTTTKTVSGDVIHPGENLSDVVGDDASVDLAATWDYLCDVRFVDGEAKWIEEGFLGFESHYEVGYSRDEATDFNYALNGYWPLSYEGISDIGDPYRVMILLCDTSSAIGIETISKNLTIRSLSDSKTLDFSNWRINASVIIDNVYLSGGGGTTSQDQSGIYCSPENRLIIGTGVTCDNQSNQYVQVAGGPNSGRDSFSMTDIRIFSGTYSNVIGGGLDGYTGTITDTNVTILGTTSVLESIIGGSIHGTVTNTHVLVAGDASVDDRRYVGDSIIGGFSTVIGGSRYNNVTTSNVEVSGNASVFAVQGGGRQASTSTENSNVLISGKATVEIAVGSVTDGNNTLGIPVTKARVEVSGTPTIGNEKSPMTGGVYGGGWDLWQVPSNSSTVRTEVIINGNPTITNVYGGGFRGSVGESSSTDADTVSITVNGGKIGAVYGGGMGGSDPGLNSGGSSDPTGPARVYGNVSVSINGGDIGTVYGGGRGSDRGSIDDGCATIEGNIDIEVDSAAKVGNIFGGGQGVTNHPYVAHVEGDISISITGTWIESGTVTSDVYGGGQLSTVEGNISIALTGINVKGSVYGGGSGEGGSQTEAQVQGDVLIRITDGASVGESVYGGGYGVETNSNVSALFGSVSIYLMGSPNGQDTVGESVYGGGRYASVYEVKGSTQTTSISLSIVAGAKVADNVYGGGMIGSSEADFLSITISDSETLIGGSVYGGGMGALGSDSGSMATGSSIMTISAGAKIEGDVYGGGAYGMFTADTVDMKLIGQSTNITGSVYGGGLGQEKKLATVVNERNIVINGPSVGGNVYGGSRYGDDNYAEGASYPQCETNIYILSGNIATGSSGNVYGGGYKGRSKMDVLIQVGSAVPKSVDEPIYEGFSIRSIYGGASVGDVSGSGTDSLLNQQLLLGDVTIEIGGFAKETDTISGDVFGAGDYCEISGTSEITFTDFEQEGSMLSIQKADSVKLVNSELVLEGNVDGNTTSGSAKFSINDVGALTLEGNSSGRSGLEMNAQVSSLSAYESISGQTIVEYNQYIINSLNYLQMNGGKMFSVLGQDNDGTIADVGGVPNLKPMNDIATRGVTLFKGDSNTYYGTFAISGPNVDDTTVFVLDDGSEAASTEYEYIDGVIVTVWYRAGAFTVDETITLYSAATGMSSGSADISIPKMSEGSEIRYVGHYVSMNSEGSLNLEESPISPGTDFKAVLGSGNEGDGNIHFNNLKGIDLANPGENTRTTDSGARVNIQISTPGYFNVTGYAGTIHIHMVEVRGSIVIGTFDIEVAVYLNLTDADDDLGINQDILVKDIEGNKHSGSTDVYLPVVTGTADYTLLSVKGLDSNADLEMTLASTNLNKSGWLLNGGDTHHLSASMGAEYLGLGGMYPPVLHFEFTCGGHVGSDADKEEWDSIIITLRVVPEGSEEGYTYTITLTPKLADQRTVIFYDMWLEADGSNVSWGYPKTDSGDRAPLFELQVDFGDSMMGIYVLIDTSQLNLKWDKEAALEKNMTGFMTQFAAALEKVEDDDGNTFVMTGTQTEMQTLLDGKEEGGWEILPVYSGPYNLLNLYQEEKQDFIKSQYASDQDKQFDENYGYLNNVRWFDNPEGPAQFNFYSQITEDDLQIFAGYGVIITFDPETTTVIAGQDDPWTNPASMFYGDLESPVDINELTQSLQVTKGYHISEFQYAQYTEENGEQVVNWVTIEDEFMLLQDVTIKVILEPDEYSIEDITIVIDNDDGKEPSPYTGDYTVEYSPYGENDFKALGENQKLHYGDSVRIVIDYGNDKKYRILSVVGIYGITTMGDDKFEITQGTDNADSTASFVMPNGDLSMTVTLSPGYKLTIGLADPEGNDNEKFELELNGSTISAMVGDGPQSVELQIGLEQSWSGTIAASFDSTHTIDILIVGDDADQVSFNDGKITITDIGRDLEIEIVLKIRWMVSFNGNFTVSSDGVPITTGETVYTGDTLTVTASTGYIFTGEPKITNGEPRGSAESSEFNVYVTGEGDVTIEVTTELHSFTVKVTIEFLSANIPVSDAVTVTITSEGKEIEVTNVGEWTYTALVNKDAEFTATASAAGYIFSVASGTSAEGVEVTVYGAEETTGEAIVSDVHIVITTYSGAINGTYSVSGELQLSNGKYSFGNATVTVSDGSVVLEGFDESIVGTVILTSSGMGTLEILSLSKTEGLS